MIKRELLPIELDPRLRPYATALRQLGEACDISEDLALIGAVRDQRTGQLLIVQLGDSTILLAMVDAISDELQEFTCGHAGGQGETGREPTATPPPPDGRLGFPLPHSLLAAAVALAGLLCFTIGYAAGIGGGN